MKYIETIREILLSPCFPTNLFYMFHCVAELLCTPTVEMWILPWKFRVARQK